MHTWKMKCTYSTSTLFYTHQNNTNIRRDIKYGHTCIENCKGTHTHEIIHACTESDTYTRRYTDHGPAANSVLRPDRVPFFNRNVIKSEVDGLLVVSPSCVCFAFVFTRRIRHLQYAGYGLFKSCYLFFPVSYLWLVCRDWAMGD